MEPIRTRLGTTIRYPDVLRRPPISTLTRFCAAIALALVILPGMSLAHARATAASGYQIRELTAPTGSRFHPTAINGGGTIVGYISSHGGSTERAAVYAGHLITIGAPPGFANSVALGVSYMGAVLIQAWSTGHPSRRFVARPYNSHYLWEQLHTGIPGYFVQSIHAIDANGDVAGAIQRDGRPQSSRAAVWIPTSQRTYPLATRMPGWYRGGTTDATTIWSGDGRIVVAGFSLGTSHGQPEAEMWTGEHGESFRAASDMFGLFATAIGGRGTHVFMVGSTDTGANYGEPVSQEASPIAFGSNGNASTTRLVNLIQLRQPWLDINGIASSGPKGEFVAVGDASPSIGGSQQAIIWRGLAGSSVYGQRLQRLLAADSPWTLNTAVGINRTGEIIGMGSYHGRYAAYLLFPPQTRSWCCY